MGRVKALLRPAKSETSIKGRGITRDEVQTGRGPTLRVSERENSAVGAASPEVLPTRERRGGEEVAYGSPGDFKRSGIHQTSDWGDAYFEYGIGIISPRVKEADMEVYRPPILERPAILTEPIKLALAEESTNMDVISRIAPDCGEFREFKLKAPP